jgi:hypothetical protein
MDIYWKNMKFVSRPFSKFARTIGTWTITWFLIFFWNIPGPLACLTAASAKPKGLARARGYWGMAVSGPIFSPVVRWKAAT